MMRAINIEFAPPSLARRLQAASILTAILMLVTVLLCAALLWRCGQLYQKKVMAEENVFSVQTELQRYEKQQAKPVVIKIADDKATAINLAIAQLNMPWTGLLDALEQATSDKVALLQVSPDMKKMRLKATAESKNSDDMIAYIEILKQQAFFSTVVLEKHEINEQDPNKPIRFQFEVQWRDEVKR